MSGRREFSEDKARKLLENLAEADLDEVDNVVIDKDGRTLPELLREEGAVRPRQVIEIIEYIDFEKLTDSPQEDKKTLIQAFVGDSTIFDRTADNPKDRQSAELTEFLHSLIETDPATGETSNVEAVEDWNYIRQVAFCLDIAFILVDDFIERNDLENSIGEIKRRRWVILLTIALLEYLQ